MTSRPMFKRFFSMLLSATLLFASVGDIPAQEGVARQPGLARGTEALTRIGTRLPEIAQRHGKTPDELKRMFESDSSLWIDSTDALVYMEEGFRVDDASAAAAESPTVQPAPFPYSETFFLSSRPGSTKTIYLDFDGHTTRGTQWNGEFNRWEDIVSAPFSLDLDPTTFSEVEQDVIQTMWQRVAEDYAPFDVNVTTQDPGEGALTRKDSSDNLYGTRLVISPTNFTRRTIGGIAFLAKFNFLNNEGYQPAFIFSDYLCENASTAQCAKYLADAGSHEVGHTLGLSHDGLRNSDGTISEYYGGHNDWAPIMGVGFGREISQWNKGEYAGANNLEDDIAVIQANGALLRADDHSNTTRGATYIGANAVNASGVISSATDVDYFTFTVRAGQATLNIDPVSGGSNINLRAQLLNSSRVVLATSNNPSSPSAGFSTTLAAGTYFLMVEGVGEGDPTAGYSDYASLGRYRISGTLVAPAGQAPIAVATSNTFSGPAPLTVNFFGSASSDPDGTISRYLWNFGDGTTSTAANPTKTFSIGARYPVTLTVTDSQGLVNTASLPIDVQVNKLPVAVLSASAFTGDAPFTVDFRSAGSFDPEGSSLTYLWSFYTLGTSTEANPSFTFTEVNGYDVYLTVTDAAGLSTTVLKSIIVTSFLYVQAVTTTKSTTTKGTSARITLTIFGSDGKPRPFAVVAGKWSGAVSASQSATANNRGQVTFTSPLTSASGPFMFTVDNISLTYFYRYDPTKNFGGTQSYVIP